MNLIDIKVTPLHVAFDETCRAAEARGLRVTGSELVGLIPLAAMLDAGRYYLRKQQRSLGVSERELIRIAVRSLGLDDLSPFDPAERIIEYRLRAPGDRRLAEPHPGSICRPDRLGIGGARRRLGRRGDRRARRLARHHGGQPLGPQTGLGRPLGRILALGGAGPAAQGPAARLVDEDTRAFDRVMAALGMPKGTGEEKRPARRRSRRRTSARWRCRGR